MASLTCFLMLLGLKHVPHVKERFNYWQEEPVEVPIAAIVRSK